MLKKIIEEFNLKESDILNVYRYGSKVYKSDNETSDQDFIIIFKNGTVKDEFAVTRGDISVHMYQHSSFQDLVTRHKITALEMCFLPKQFVLKEDKPFNCKIDLQKLRSTISEKASHSFVKAKKKIIVEKDRDLYISKKSLFHSLRIIEFGIQMAKHNRITDYSAANDIWIDIYTDPSTDWEHYHEKFKPIFNSKMSDFRELAPK